MSSCKTFSDSQLILLLQDDDCAAYTEIYTRYSNILLNHAYNKTRDREEAKDAVHEVFVMLWSNRSKMSNISNLAGYLYSSLRNCILNQVAHKGVESKYLSSLMQFASHETVADHLVREKQLTEIIEKEIDNLPSKMRKVFKLSRNGHLNHKEIAGQLNISEQTVSKHITNALKILRLRLGIIIYFIFIANF